MRKFLIGLVLMVPLTTTAVGCKSIPEAGGKRLKKNFLLVKKDYKKYLDKDPKYDNDPEAKADRLGLIDDSVELIDEALK